MCWCPRADSNCRHPFWSETRGAPRPEFRCSAMAVSLEVRRVVLALSDPLGTYGVPGAPAAKASTIPPARGPHSSIRPRFRVTKAMDLRHRLISALERPCLGQAAAGRFASAVSRGGVTQRNAAEKEPVSPTRQMSPRATYAASHVGKPPRPMAPAQTGTRRIPATSDHDVGGWWRPTRGTRPVSRARRGSHFGDCWTPWPTGTIGVAMPGPNRMCSSTSTCCIRTCSVIRAKSC